MPLVTSAAFDQTKFPGNWPSHVGPAVMGRNGIVSARPPSTASNAAPPEEP